MLHILSLTWLTYWDWLTLLILICGVCLWPRLIDSLYAPIERVASGIASRKATAIIIIVFVTLALRISLIPVFPVRPPGIQDEFSYQLAGETFAHGRLANPAHPMSQYFDTFNELFEPTYASMYEPAQGAFLAFGQLIGHPWIGVLLSMSIMLGALMWMLQGWLPPRWALLGASLPFLRLGIFSYWMNSYWGGAVAALGGCLVIGAFPRLIRRRKPIDSLILGIGAALVANSRPYEGFLTLIPLAVAIAIWLVRNWSDWSAIALRVALPLLLVATMSGAFMLYYNWRVTGSPVLFPHRLYEHRFMSMSIFVWPEQGPTMKYSNPQFDTMFSHYSRNQYRRNWPEFQRITWRKLKDFCNFYLGPAGMAAFAALPWVLIDNKTALVRWMLLMATAASTCAIWFSPHYAAPALGALIILLVQLFRHLRRWTYHGRPIGVGLTRALVTVAIATFIYQSVESVRYPRAPLPNGWGWWALWDRNDIESRLQSTPGKHLIIVRYSPTVHDVHREWVYNHADIDGSKVVWAREIPGISMQPLLNYYRDRRIWLVEPDSTPRTLTPYIPAPTVSSNTQSTAKAMESLALP